MLRPGLFLLLALLAVTRVNAAETSQPAPKRSLHMTEVLRAAARDHEAAAGTRKESSPAADQRPRVAEVAPANTIVRLPPYIVRQDKLPDAEEVLTERELAKVAMRRYLGDEQGLDRALNVVTIKHLWNKLPVLGRFQLLNFETNEERALRIHRETKKAEEWAELLGLQRAKMQPGSGPLKLPAAGTK